MKGFFLAVYEQVVAFEKNNLMTQNFESGPTLADLCDHHGDQLRVAQPLLRSFGGLSAFQGTVYTLRVFEDNSLVRWALETPGEGRVLVVDGGESRRCALLGDKLAQLGLEQGWSGIVIHGCIRDRKVVSQIPIGVLALATNPRRSVKQSRGEEGVELSIAGISICPGNWLYADEDGFAVSDRELSEGV